MIKRAKRMQPIVGFGIDRVAAAAEETGDATAAPISGWSSLERSPASARAVETTLTMLRRFHEVLALPGSHDFQQYIHINRSLKPLLMRPS